MPLVRYEGVADFLSSCLVPSLVLGFHKGLEQIRSFRVSPGSITFSWYLCHLILRRFIEERWNTICVEGWLRFKLVGKQKNFEARFGEMEYRDIWRSYH